MKKYVIEVAPATVDSFEKTDIRGSDGFREFSQYLSTHTESREFLEHLIPQTTLYEANELFGGVKIVEAKEA